MRRLLIVVLTGSFYIVSLTLAWADEGSIQNKWYSGGFKYGTEAKDMGTPDKSKGGIILSGDCSDYHDLSGLSLPIAVAGTTAGATNDFGPFAAPEVCWRGDWYSLSAAAPDVTYKWTAPFAGCYTISLCGSLYDNVLLLYNFTCPVEPVFPDDFLCGSDDYCALSAEITDYWFDAGQEILIVVDGYGSNTGSFTLQIDHYPIAPIDSFLTDKMDQYHMPGLATCVIKDEAVCWTGTYGYANIAQNIEVSDTTIFILASLSKPVTGMALMQLWEEELFNLDENINNYLPFPVSHPYYPSAIITFRMLLSHTSGIRDNYSILNPLTVPGDSPIPLDTFLVNYLVPGGYYYNASQNFYNLAPGSQYRYSNMGVVLAGYLVQSIRNDGVSFNQHCRDSIFTPLNMNETAFFISELDTNNFAMPYGWNGYAYVPYGHYSGPHYPVAFLRSSISDMADFLNAFMQYGRSGSIRVLDSLTVETMITIQPTVDPNLWILYKQGLIWFYCNFRGKWAWGHAGSHDGVRTAMFYVPEENIGTIVLTNGEYSWDILEEMTHELLVFATGWPYGYVSGIVTDTSMNPIEGVYINASGTGAGDFSNSSGEYMLHYLPPGIHDISFSHDNYFDTTVTGVAVTAGDTAVLHMQMALAGCDYVTGDVNGSDNYNGLDIIYGVNYFKGEDDPLCPECGLCPDWYYCGDVNGSCNYNGLDITYGVAYFKGGPDPIPCPDCPPVG